MFKEGVVFLICFYLVSSQNLTPDDEEFSVTGVLNDFLTQLEVSSGLSTLVPSRVVTGIDCPGYSECTINPNGTVLWDVRADLYKTYMMQGTDDITKQNTTLDGCLKYNPTNITSYNTCMHTVRFDMRTDLIVNFQSNFISLLEANCSSVPENCIVSTE